MFDIIEVQEEDDIMRIMIIDDEYSYSLKLKGDIYPIFRKLSDSIDCDVYNHPRDIDYSIYYDFAFIDIDLPNKNGIMIAEEIKKNFPKSHIVFVSSHSNLVHNTLVVNPFYFIRKRNYEDDLKIFTSLVRDRIKKEEVIELKYNDEFYHVFIKNIIYVEAQSHKIKVYTNEKQYYDNRTLSQMSEILSSHCFVRIHRSFIINVDYITKLKGDNIELNGSIGLKVGRSYKEEFINFYDNILLR